jgi:membrane protein required for colicin V production
MPLRNQHHGPARRAVNAMSDHDRYDLLMLAVLAGSILYGAWRGMAWQVASLASLVLSYFVAVRYSPALAGHIELEPPLNRAAAMLVLYAFTSLAVWVAFRLAARLIDRVKLKEFDRQLGALFGGIKGLLLCLVITFFALALSQRWREPILRSRSGNYLAWLVARVDPLLPAELHELLEPYLDDLEGQLEPRQAGAGERRRS